MLRTSESETEILLGNKQLLGIFFVLAALLGLAFYGGYKVGHETVAKRTAATPVTPAEDTASVSSHSATGGETHTFPADTSSQNTAGPPASETASPDISSDTAPPLGSRKTSDTKKALPPPAVSAGLTAFTPAPGEEFLQVAAVGKDEAEAVADVLQKKGFKAHAIPKPGNAKLFRVLIGPIQDAAELSSTRDSLRRTGFREVIVQHY